MVIPEGWKHVELSEICTKIGSGKTPHGGESVYTIDGIMLIRSQNVDNGKMLLADVAYIDDGINSTMANTELQRNDVLLNITGASIGRCCSYELGVRANVNQHVCIIRLKKDTNHRLIMYQLLGEYGQRQIEAFQTGAKQGLNFQQIAKIYVLLPKSKTEQTAIATALSDMDDLIASLEKLLAKKQGIKQGAMQDLLTGRKRLKGFSGEWEKTFIKDIANIFNGDRGDNYPSGKDFTIEGVPFVNAGHIKDNVLDFSDMDYISEEYYQKLGGVKFQRQDIIFCLRGSLGKHAFIAFDNGVPASSLCVIRCKNVGQAAYLFQLLDSSMTTVQIENANSGSSQPNLSADSIAKFAYIMPIELKEQIAIAEMLMDMDDEITALQQKLAKYRQIKQGMMAELLTGRIRLKEA